MLLGPFLNTLTHIVLKETPERDASHPLVIKCFAKILIFLNKPLKYGKKYLQTFSGVTTISLHRKRDGTRKIIVNKMWIYGLVFSPLGRQKILSDKTYFDF